MKRGGTPEEVGAREGRSAHPTSQHKGQNVYTVAAGMVISRACEALWGNGVQKP